MTDRSGTPRSSSSLDLSSAVKNPLVRTDDGFEILCNDVVLPLDITLAAVRQFVWRQSSELVMYYRRKLVWHGEEFADSARGV
jgi:WD repeat-containing protein 48